MINGKKVTAIILAAGDSRRFGKKRNKIFEKIHGRSVLSYSLEVFDQNEYIDNIIVAIKENEKPIIDEIISEGEYRTNFQIVIGGSARSESVYNSLKATEAEIAIIHDGARPLIKSEYIDKCVESMERHRGVTMGVKSKDTIKITDEDGNVINSTDRANTWIIQTPQCFHRELLLAMHEKFKGEPVTDDCQLLEKGGHPIKVIEGDYTNIKVTTYDDCSIIKEFID